MHIDRTVKGEKFRYSVQPIPNTMTARVKYWQADEGEICKISEDFKYILLPDTFVTPWISGIGHVKVGRLKLNRAQQFEAKDYNEKFKKIFFKEGDTYIELAPFKTILELLVTSKEITEIENEEELKVEIANGAPIFCAIDPYDREINGMNNLIWEFSKDELEEKISKSSDEI